MISLEKAEKRKERTPSSKSIAFFVTLVVSFVIDCFSVCLHYSSFLSGLWFFFSIQCPTLFVSSLLLLFFCGLLALASIFW